MPTTNRTEFTGYWTFFCNPARWEIDRFLETNNKTDTYQVTEWQKDWFFPGQLGVIRVGTDRRTEKQLGGRDRLEAGIYGIVEIKSTPQKRADKPDKYWLDWSSKELGKPVVEIYYLENLLDRPILLSHLQSDEQINDPYLLHGFQASSMPLTKRSFERVMEITQKSTKIIESIDETLEPNTLENIRLLEQKYANAVPEVKETISQRIERGSLANKIKALNGYRCQICEALGHPPLSFRKKNGEFYIESHHVIPISARQMGSLSLLNLITVCANHHRQIHFGDFELIEQTETAFTFSIDGNQVSIIKTVLTA
ncbi:MAG TPA: HNH endonuclease [Anaerolineales bacterium]|nr:HNH endonuclease [Anaerolineales bacterium]